MEVILRKDVEKIGKAGAVAKVKEGFARNFLFPRDLARPVTDAALKKLEQDALARSMQSAKIKEESVKLQERLSSLSLTISVLAQGEAPFSQGEEKLYGSINANEVSAALEEKGFLIDKNIIDLAEPIKSLGVYEIPIKLHPEVIAKLKLWVVKK